MRSREKSLIFEDKCLRLWEEKNMKNIPQI